MDHADAGEDFPDVVVGLAESGRNDQVVHVPEGGGADADGLEGGLPGVGVVEGWSAVDSWDGREGLRSVSGQFQFRRSLKQL